MKNIIQKLITAIMVAILGCGFIATGNVKAEDAPNTSMFVTPMSQELLLVPGEKYEGIITVSNAANAQDTLNYLVKVGSYGWNKGDDDSDDYGGINVETRSERNQIMDWITLGRTSGTIKPNENDKIPFTINVPENAPAGAQYASILVVRDDENDASTGDHVVIQNIFQLASAIIANVAGETSEKGVITENNIPSFLTTGHLETSSMVKNEGNVYTNAEYTLQVWPMFGDEEICTNEEKPEISMVLPDTERYHVQTCDLRSIGLFKARQVVKIFGETSITEKTIIVCPLWLLFIVVFIVAAIIIWLIIRIRGHNRKSE